MSQRLASLGHKTGIQLRWPALDLSMVSSGPGACPHYDVASHVAATSPGALSAPCPSRAAGIKKRPKANHPGRKSLYGSKG